MGPVRIRFPDITPAAVGFGRRAGAIAAGRSGSTVSGVTLRIAAMPGTRFAAVFRPRVSD